MEESIGREQFDKEGWFSALIFAGVSLILSIKSLYTGRNMFSKPKHTSNHFAFALIDLTRQ